MMKLKKRTFLILMAALTATFASAQKQPLPEWQSQYAVGLNKLAPLSFPDMLLIYNTIFQALSHYFY